MCPKHGELGGGVFRIDYDPKLHIAAQEVKDAARGRWCEGRKCPLIIVIGILLFMCVLGSHLVHSL